MVVSRQRIPSFSGDRKRNQKSSQIFITSAPTPIFSAFFDRLLRKLIYVSSSSEIVCCSRAPDHIYSGSAAVTKRWQSPVFLFANEGETSAMAAATDTDSVLRNREIKNLRRWRRQFRIPYSDLSSITTPETTGGLSGSLEPCFSKNEHMYSESQSPLYTPIFHK